jgi:serine/threonine protein kinase
MRNLDDLRPIYTSFENRTREILLQHRMVDEISPFQIKEWFLICLAGGKLTEKNTGVKHVIASRIHGVVLSLFQHQFKAVDQYRKMVRHYVATKNFQQQKAQLSGLITNLMDLLAWLNQKKIAMRDLKPDNLLVAGNPSKFPQFLESPALYSIGLIDVETAVSFDSRDYSAVQQPPLGGTPAYSTPSHMLRNDTLVKVFGDLPQVLHLQDWHATMGIIYLVATGDRLFEQTAKILLQLKASIKDKAKKKSKPLETIAQASQKFWQYAMAEFDQKLKDHHKQLYAIEIIISETARPILFDTISDSEKRVAETIRQLAASQKIFRGEKTQENLAAASYASISHFQLKFMDEQAKQLSDKNKAAASHLLDELIYLKKQSAHLKSAAAALQKSVPIFKASELLNTMFTIVMVNMHQRLWGPINFHGQ